MNPDQTSRSERSPRRHRMLYGLLGLLVVVEVVTVFVVLASQQYATDRALRDYSHELMQNVIDETRENAAGFLRRAQDSVSLASGIFEAHLLSCEEPDRLERYFLEQLRVLPQIDAIYYGDRNGNFVFSKREQTEDGGGFLTKVIRRRSTDESQVTLITRDADLVERQRRPDPTDRYDPRLRPWFERARHHSHEVWTDPYIFYTSQQPGLTVARAVRDPAGGLQGVIGADIEVSALSRFLKTQQVGQTGAAFIVYSNGDVLAHPDLAGLVQRNGDDRPRLRRLNELDVVSAQAGARLVQRFADLSTMQQSHYDDFNVGDERYLSIFVPLLTHGENQWVMGVYAPESELAQTIREGQRESIYLGVAVSLLLITAAVVIGLILLRPIHTLQRQAGEDPLTGLLNRRSFGELAAERLAAARVDQRMAAIMIDIDRFKPINDEYGHTVGDEVLLAVSRRINRGLSDEDLLSRYGGEEFAAVLPHASLVQALSIAERLREVVAQEPIKTSIGPLQVTISLGVAESGPGIAGVAALLDQADQGLLKAKRSGRNCVMTAGPEATIEPGPAAPSV